jgi:hypothetical protein
MRFPVVTVLDKPAYAGDREDPPTAHERLTSVHGDGDGDGDGRTLHERLMSTTTTAASNHAVPPASAPEPELTGTQPVPLTAAGRTEA